MNIFKHKENLIERRKLIVLSVFFIFLLLLIFVLTLLDSKNYTGVEITTNKKKYSEGDVVKIVIENHKKTSIDFQKLIDRVWDIQVLEKGKWDESTEIMFGEKGKYFLENKVKENDGSCNIKSTSSELFILSPGELMSFDWDQTGCLATSKDKTVSLKRAIKGTYRVSFTYSYEETNREGEKNIITETSYSQPFSLK